CLSSNGRVGVQGNDFQVGFCKHEEPAEVPPQPGWCAVQGGHTVVQHPLVFERGQRDLPVLRMPSSLVGGVPRCGRVRQRDPHSLRTLVGCDRVLDQVGRNGVRVGFE
ncbi:unnamed protein product, partial [Pylaiella littoralis]